MTANKLSWQDYVYFKLLQIFSVYLEIVENWSSKYLLLCSIKICDHFQHKCFFKTVKRGLVQPIKIKEWFGY